MAKSLGQRVEALEDFVARFRDNPPELIFDRLKTIRDGQTWFFRSLAAVPVAYLLAKIVAWATG